MVMRTPLLLLVILVASFVSISDAASVISTPRVPDNGYIVEGRVKLEGLGARPSPSKSANVKIILNAGQELTFIRLDGYFSFQGVTAGTHLLEVSALGYSFSPVRVDVSARLHGQVRALAVETRRYYSDTLMILEPIRAEDYYEKREPFSAMSLLKSPMGLMVGFMVVALFLLPKLMDSIDPEEMKRVQEEMRNQPAPSFSNLLQGRSQ